MWASVIFSLLLSAFGMALIVWHVVAWRSARRSDCGGKQLAFARQQFVRRTQTSTLLFLLGAALAAGDWMPEGWPALCYWSALLFVVFWIGALALADMLAVQSHFHEQQASQLGERYHLEQQAPPAGDSQSQRPFRSRGRTHNP
jgi:hypothetical protein